MTSQEYEKLVHDLYTNLLNLADAPTSIKVAFGSSSKVRGASGYDHQIDVAIYTDEVLLLVECKHWTKTVNVPTFLTFLARVHDIATTEKQREVIPVVVTTVDFQKGVKQLAGFYEIQLERVTSTHEFAVRYKDCLTIGASDRGQCTETATLQAVVVATDAAVCTESVGLIIYDEQGNVVERRGVLTE